MKSPDPGAAYRAATEALILDIRANGRPTSGPFTGRLVLLLTTVGARTGTRRTAPLVYSRDGDDLVVAASKGGSPDHPGWYHNLVANPQVRVETGGESFEARATPVEEAERDRRYAQHALDNPGFLDYQRRTSRVIPVIRLTRLP